MNADQVALPAAAGAQAARPSILLKLRIDNIFWRVAESVYLVIISVGFSLTRTFMERDMTQSDLFLAPTVSHLQLPDLAKASPPANTERRSRIGMDSHTESKAQVFGNAAHA